MAESQNIEWKQAWRDEYLKWICGFANAQGGKIYIGTKDDALEKRLIMLLKATPSLTQKEISGELSVSRATIQRIVKKLMNENKLERKGGKRFGYWEVRE